MVNLAPHLVKPLPLLIPAFDGRHPDRKSGVGLNLYDVMSRERRGSRRRGQGRDPEYWSPERHRTVDAAETLEMLPALAPREPTSAYLFYDCQTDDTRLVFTVLGEAERFGAVCANAVEVEGLVERDGRAAGVLCRDTLGGGEFELLRRERGQRHRRVGRPDPPRRAARRGRGAAHQAQPRHPRDRVAGQAAGGLGGDRAVGGRAVHLRAAVAGPDAHRHHRRDLRERPARPHPGRRRGRGVPAGCRQRVLRHRPDRGRPERRLRGRAPADLHRRPEEVGGHLAQGRAVRDQLGHDHHHRRQAHHVAPHGPAHGGPDRRARGPRGALPHHRDPAGHAAGARRAGRAIPSWTTPSARTWPAATGTPRST